MAISQRKKFIQGQTTPFNIFGGNKPKAPNLAPSNPTSPFNLSGQNQTKMPVNMSTASGDAYTSPKPIASSPANTEATTPRLSTAGQQFAANQADPDIQKFYDAGIFNKPRDRDAEADARFGTTQAPPQQSSGSDQKSKYIDSLKAEQFPISYKAEQDARDKAANRLATVQNMREKAELDARNAYEAELDKPGGTKAGAQQSAALSRRRSNDELADIALQENAALRYAQVAQGIFESAQGQDRQLTLDELQALNDEGANLSFGSTISDAQRAGTAVMSETKESDSSFSLSEGQTRWEKDADGIYQPVAGAGGGDGSGIDQGGRTEAEKFGTQLDFLIETATGAMDFAGASGVSGIGKWFGDTFVGDSKFRQLEVFTNTLRTNAMSLVGDPDIKKFFGPQMSDADVRLMTSANTTLNPDSQNPEQMYDEAKRLLELFQRLSAYANSQGVSGGGEGLYDF